MKPARKIFLLVLVTLLGATVYGLVRTEQRTANPSGSGTTTAATPGQVADVDQAPLFTAQKLVRLPTSATELPFAQQALQLGDQEMDLAFAVAVADATTHPVAMSAEAKAIEGRLQKAEDALAAQQAQVAQLTAAEAKASGAQKDALESQLDLAQARLELDQDEVDDARQDLSRAGGDPQGRIQAMVQEHEAASQASDTTKVNVTPAVQARGLVNRFQEWSALHEKQLQLWRARQDALSAAAAFGKQHDSVQQEIDKDSQSPAALRRAAPPAKAGAKGGNPDVQDLLTTTKLRAADRKTVVTLAKRADNERRLAGVYDQWIGAVAAEQRSIANGALRGALVILGIALVGLFFDGWIERLLGKTSMDRRQVETLRTVTRVTLQIFGVLLVLLVIFGPPNQLGTILGLAGAGLTVALKDFIIGFFGWFVLMGRNGIRLGDWVEINGVTGEVVELGMFHTVLLETGNWTDSGHPTGRRVTFTNSFAIEGHYFNFSTSGQWLWDELQIVLPAGQNPYPIVDAIEKKVLEATSESARQAEQEWQGAARTRDMSALSAAPAINVRPVIGGTEISVRYITRANERAQLRAKLNHAAVDLLGQPPAPQSTPDSPKPAITPVKS